MTESVLFDAYLPRKVHFSGEFFCEITINYTQLVASLQTSRQEVVLARFVTSCQQV